MTDVLARPDGPGSRPSGHAPSDREATPADPSRMPTVTAEQIAEMDRLSYQASPGVWSIWPERIHGRDDAIRELTEQVEKTEPLGSHLFLLNAEGKCPATAGCGPFAEANAEFIAALVNGYRSGHLRPTPAALEAARARPLSEWTEEDGNVLWWVFPITEAPYCGSPLDVGRTCEITLRLVGEEHVRHADIGGWPGYHTHWTPIPYPDEPPAPCDGSGEAGETHRGSTEGDSAVGEAEAPEAVAAKAAPLPDSYTGGKGAP